MIRGSVSGKLVASRLLELNKISEKAFETAMARGAIQLLTWMNTGSAKEPKKPPIRKGILRGSGSTFVGSKFIGSTPTHGAKGTTPLKNYSGKPEVITVVYNTEYATRMHEWKGGWGEFTLQDGDAGNKWIESHLQHDKDDLMKMIGIEFAKEAGI